MAKKPSSDVLAYCSVVFKGGDPSMGALEGQVGMLLLSPDHIVFGVPTQEIEEMIASQHPFIIQDMDFRLAIALPNILANRITETDRDSEDGLLSKLLQSLRPRRTATAETRFTIEYADPEGKVHKPIFALPSLRGRTDPRLLKALTEFHLALRNQMETHFRSH